MGSIAQDTKPRSWHRDGYFLTTDKAYLDAEAVNVIFDSDLMWWNTPMDVASTRRMLDNCLTFAIYATGDGGDHRLVGFSRLVTDYVTFAYLTDVFVIREYQRRGLARWMMQCVREMLSPWPFLRGILLMTGDEAAARMYKQALGAVDFQEGPSKGMVLLEMPGKAEVPVPDGYGS